MLKQCYKYANETPGWSSIHSHEKNQNQIYKQSNNKCNTEFSILQKIKSSKIKNMNEIDISSKMKIIDAQSDSKYFMLSNQKNLKDNKKLNNNDPYKFKQDTKKAISSFNPHFSDKKNIQNSSQRHQVSQHLNRSASYKKYLQPTQNWMNKISPQKVPSRSSSQIKINQKNFSPVNRSSLNPAASQISVHEQLYLDSKRKEMKQQAELIIQNQYFKKKHPFQPQIGIVSQFLAQQKIERLKQRQKFQQEFQQFQDWSQVQKDMKIKQLNNSKISKSSKSDYLDVQHKLQRIEKQAELKNYQMLKQFFYFLSDQENCLTFSHLSSQKLCELPTGLLKLLQPIIQQFYKNRIKKSSNWMQFLSQFNLKIKNRKSFFLIIQKWFLVRFEIVFDKQSNEDKSKPNKKTLAESIYKEKDDSTYINQSVSEYSKKYKNR